MQYTMTTQRKQRIRMTSACLATTVLAFISWFGAGATTTASAADPVMLDLRPVRREGEEAARLTADITVEAEVTDAGAAAGAEDESATETTDTPAVEAAPADAPAASANSASLNPLTALWPVLS